MTDPSKFRPYKRKAYLASVSAKDRPTAERLCKLLEEAYPPSEIVIYSGFPVVVRDGEWLAGFAMRAKCPMIYCCSPHTLQKMGKELKPLMAGKSCLELRAKGGVSLEQAYELVRRAFIESTKGPGSISETDRRRRDAARRKAALPAVKVAKKTAKKATKKATKKTAARRSR